MASKVVWLVGIAAGVWLLGRKNNPPEAGQPLPTTTAEDELVRAVMPAGNLTPPGAAEPLVQANTPAGPVLKTASDPIKAAIDSFNEAKAAAATPPPSPTPAPPTEVFVPAPSSDTATPAQAAAQQTQAAQTAATVASGSETASASTAPPAKTPATTPPKPTPPPPRYNATIVFTKVVLSTQLGINHPTLPVGTDLVFTSGSMFRYGKVLAKGALAVSQGLLTSFQFSQKQLSAGVKITVTEALKK